MSPPPAGAAVTRTVGLPTMALNTADVGVLGVAAYTGAPVADEDVDTTTGFSGSVPHPKFVKDISFLLQCLGLFF